MDRSWARRFGHFFLVLALVQVAIALISLAIAILGPADQRVTAFGVAVGAFGSAFASAIIGFGLTALGRST